MQPYGIDSGSGLLVPWGSEIPLYSWVQTPSADPADLDPAELWLFSERDLEGTWWFTAQDCTEPPVSIEEATSTADVVADLTIQSIPGTELVIPYEGVYTYNVEVDVTIANVAGNQFWDLTLGIYSVTDAAWVGTYDYAGTGTPVQPVFRIRSSTPELMDAAAVGDTLILGCTRASATGDVTILTGSKHSLTGPIK